MCPLKSIDFLDASESQGSKISPKVMLITTLDLKENKTPHMGLFQQSGMNKCFEEVLDCEKLFFLFFYW